MLWRDHELCGPAAEMPAHFWGPEDLDYQAWLEFAARLDTTQELEVLLDAIAGARDLCDVGGGSGLLTRALAPRLERVVVVEPSAAHGETLSRAQGGKLSLRPGRAEAIPARDGEFHAVMATWVLQYTEDPFVAVAELARVCADEPDARVLIVQAAPWNQIVQIYNAEARVAGAQRAHHGFLLAGAADTLETSGFSQISLSVCPATVRVADGDAVAAASLLQRLHFNGHPRSEAILAETRPMIQELLSRTPGSLNDDGVLLLAKRGY